MYFQIVFLGILLLTPLPLLASVVVNEVMFDPLGTDTGLERIELYNSGTVPENISGWAIYPDGVGYIIFPQNTSISGKGFLLIYLRISGTNTSTDFYFPQASGNLGNTSGSVVLFSGEPRGKDTIKSFVEWGKEGQTWESTASSSGLWTKGTFVTGYSEGNSIGLIADGNTNGGVSAWKVFSGPTPGSTNSPLTPGSSSSTESIHSSSSNGSSLSVESRTTIFPSIKAYGGDDKTVAAGSSTDFLAMALGAVGEPLENARFWWNFGDGSSQEGRAVSHIFSIPGIYTVGLHVSSGIYAVSDYLAVTVIPNQLKVESVIPGEQGFVRLKNPGDVGVDIGGWLLEAQGKQFIIPWRTKIAKGSVVALPNQITGLNQVSLDDLALRYPNSVLALQYKRVSQAVSLEIKQQETPVSVSLPSELPSEPDMRESSTSPTVSKEFASTSSSANSRLLFIVAVLLSLAAAVGFIILRRF
jgi:hypothetical protein